MLAILCAEADTEPLKKGMFLVRVLVPQSEIGPFKPRHSELGTMELKIMRYGNEEVFLRLCETTLAEAMRFNGKEVPYTLLQRKAFLNGRYCCAL